MALVSTTNRLGDLDGCLGHIQRGVAIRIALMSLGNPQVPHGQALLDAVGLFEELKVGYALVGGIAAMYYGRARFTEDLDFVALTGHRGLLDANPEAMKKHHFNPGYTWKLYHESGVDIDLWKDEHADAIVSRAQTARMAGREVRIAEVHDLIAMKLRAGRPQDDYDISEIVKATGIDEGVLRERVTGEEFVRFEGIRGRVKG